MRYVLPLLAVLAAVMFIAAPAVAGTISFDYKYLVPADGNPAGETAVRTTFGDGALNDGLEKTDGQVLAGYSVREKNSSFDIVLDLGALYDVGKVDVWWPANTNAGIGILAGPSMVVKFAATEAGLASATATTVDLAAIWGADAAAQLANPALHDTSYGTSWIHQTTIDVSETGARFVQVTHNNFGWSGVSEIEVTEIPEPTSLALLGLGGLGLLMTLRRRRR